MDSWLQVEVSMSVDKLKDQAAATMASVYRDRVVEIMQEPNAAAVTPLLPATNTPLPSVCITALCR